MNTKTKETIEKSIPLIDQAAQAIKDITDALGSVIIRAADIPTSGSNLGAAIKTLPQVQNQILFAARQIEQAMKEECAPADEAAVEKQEAKQSAVAGKKK